MHIEGSISIVLLPLRLDTRANSQILSCRHKPIHLEIRCTSPYHPYVFFWLYCHPGHWPSLGSLTKCSMVSKDVNSNNQHQEQANIKLKLTRVRLTSIYYSIVHTIELILFCFAVPCNKYLCPTTLDCVDVPVQCPCPYAEDIKCIIPDHGLDGKPDKTGAATVVCVSGKDACLGLQKLL